MLIGPNLTPVTVNLRYDSNFFKVKVYYCQRLLVATGWMCHVQKPKVTSQGLRICTQAFFLTFFRNCHQLKLAQP